MASSDIQDVYPLVYQLTIPEQVKYVAVFVFSAAGLHIFIV